MKKIISIFLLSFLGIVSFAQSPDWSVNALNYQYSENLTGVLSKNGDLINTTDNVLGAFVDEELRGVANAVSVNGQQMFFMTIYSNITSGEIVKFKTYIADEDSIYNLKDSIVFEKNAILGEPANPYILYLVNSNTDFLAYSFAQQLAPAIIDTANNIIDIELVNGTSLSSLIAEFTLSDGATVMIGTVEQISGITTNDFTNPVVYTVTAEDGAATENWTVNATVSSVLSNHAEILSFSFNEQTGSTIIDTSNLNINIEVSNGTNLSNLIATFSISSGAIAYVGITEQESGVTANDFSSSVVYTVIAQDLTTEKQWTVTVTEAVSENNETEILSFSMPQQVELATINNVEHVVLLEVETGTDLFDLVATFSLSNGATAVVNGTTQISDNTINNFTYPLIYTITAEDGTSIQNWIVHVYDVDQFIDTTFVTVYDSISVTDTLIIDVLLTGLSAPDNQNTIKIYPNPANDYVIINSGEYNLMDTYKVKIVSTIGETVFESYFTQQEFSIDVNDFGAYGLYFVQIIDGLDNIVITRKIILE